MLRHIGPVDLQSKVIDIHSHAGVSVKAWACGEYPYAQSIEDLRYRQRASGVDVSVVFPISPDLFLNVSQLAKGVSVPADDPVSPIPFSRENTTLLREIFLLHEEVSTHFMPFVCIDPERDIPGQIHCLEELEKKFPIYGLKVNPTACQTRIRGLNNAGGPLLDFARERDLPLLLHTTADTEEHYSYAGGAFQVIERNPDLRFCLAHCIGFHRGFLELADDAPNVWVDSAAMKIQVQLASEGSPIMAADGERFEADYSDHRKVFRALVDRFPHTMIWGTDSPYYTFHAIRKHSEGVFREFRLQGTFEEEKAALDYLSEDQRRLVSNENSRSFLFGGEVER